MIQQILSTHLKDNVQARRLCDDSTYQRVTSGEDEPVMHSQQWMIEHYGVWHRDPD